MNLEFIFVHFINHYDNDMVSFLMLYGCKSFSGGIQVDAEVTACTSFKFSNSVAQQTMIMLL